MAVRLGFALQGEMGLVRCVRGWDLFTGQGFLRVLPRQQTERTYGALRENAVFVDMGGLNGSVPERFLQRTGGGIVFKAMHGERMPLMPSSA